jgi:hypothetical protein
MTAAVVRFPLRRARSILIVRERDGGGWLVLQNEHGWLHGDRRAAIAEAQWLANNFGVPVREVA